MAVSTYLANLMLDAGMRGAAPAVPDKLYVSLHTADPGKTGAGEVTPEAWPAYARQDATAGGGLGAAFLPAADSSTSNKQKLLFPALDGADPVEVTHFGVWTDVGGGTYLYGGELEKVRTIETSDEAVIYAGSLTLSVA